MPAHSTSPTASSTLAGPAAAPGRATADARATGGIIVATAGTPDSDAALRLARGLAGRVTADVVVLSAVPPAAVADTAVPRRFRMPTAVRPRRAARDAQVAGQLARAGLDDSGWRVEIVAGSAPEVIGGRARALDAQLIVLGRRRRPPRTGAGASLALRLLRNGSVPVLVAAPGRTELPRRVVLATDFSPHADYAAQVALTLAAPDALLYLVHVRPTPPLGADPERWTREYQAQAHDQAMRSVAALGRGSAQRVEIVTLAGHPATALAEFADAAGADLVACGAHGRGAVQRLLVGSVAAALLHHASCGVLCVPGSATTRAAHRRLLAEGVETATIPRAEWASALDALSRREAGRPCSVELDHPGIGAQELATRLPFDGADYDPHGDRVTLRVRAVGDDGRQLAHVIANVRAVHLMADERGAAWVLRIADDTGQALVRFHE